jgi:tetraacyldisaccharide 4'-kinase
MLREPIAGLRRAGVVVLTRADMLDAEHREKVWEVVRRIAPKAVCAEAVHAPQALVAASGRREPLQSLRGASVAAFCGVGNPAGFRHTLDACGCHLAAFREFPDHHRYTSADLESLAAWIRRLDVSAVLCTQKDLVKITMDELGGRPLWAVGVALEFTTGQTAVEDQLRALLMKILSQESPLPLEEG